MEKKKILLVAVSVGIFLVIAIGAAILIFSPRSGASPNAVVMERSNQNTYTYPGAAPAESVPVYPRIAAPETDYQTPADPAPGYQYPPPQAPGYQYPPPQTPGYQYPPAQTSPSSTATQENNFYINGEGQRQSSYTERTVERTTNTQAAPPQVVINVPRPEGTPVPVMPEARPAAAKSGSDSKTTVPVTPSAKPAPAVPAARPAAPAQSAAARQPAPSTPAKAATPAAPAKTATPAPARAATPAAPAKTTAASKPAAPARTYDAYWVQAGSFSTKIRADGVKETLASKGITSIIENRDIEGKTFYRVRIGPYTSQNEADYWLALVQTLDGFQESQVWKSQAQRLN
jgi:cell division protein FtsN